ncbi:MAG TPA: hypothetical protein EYP85_10200 [Armatimonadetes bacterium]|nr:hypothetical protein [Armatimonadota bacterium]
MLTGNYLVKLDRAGRLTIPARMRRYLSEELILAPNLPGDGPRYLLLYTFEEWSNLMALVRPRPTFDPLTNDTARFFSHQAEAVVQDSNHRILISAKLRSWAGLQREVVVVGVIDHAELWGREQWEEYTEHLQSEETQRRLLEALRQREQTLFPSSNHPSESRHG